MNASVANIIVSMLFGKRFDYEDPQFLRLLTLTGENVKLIGSPGITVIVYFPFIFESSEINLIVQEITSNNLSGDCPFRYLGFLKHSDYRKYHELT